MRSLGVGGSISTGINIPKLPSFSYTIVSWYKVHPHISVSLGYAPVLTTIHPWHWNSTVVCVEVHGSPTVLHHSPCQRQDCPCVVSHSVSQLQWTLEWPSYRTTESKKGRRELTNKPFQQEALRATRNAGKNTVTGPTSEIQSFQGF